MIGLHGQLDFIPNAFASMTSGVVLQPFNDHYELMKFRTSYLVLNSGSNIQLWIGLLLLGMISATLWKVL